MESPQNEDRLYNLFAPPPLHSLATNVSVFQPQEIPLPWTVRALVGSCRGEAVGDGGAGPGAGGQPHPDQSECGQMGSSPLSLGETSLVSVIMGDGGGRKPVSGPDRGAAGSRVGLRVVPSVYLSIQQQADTLIVGGPSWTL